MSARFEVAVLVGSLRKESISLRLARALPALASDTLHFKHVDIGELPLFNQDFEAAPNPAVTAMKGQVSSANALLFVTPEYNRSVPGVLKNAIDVGSRPYGKSVWFGKPAAIISISPGAMGAFGANHHLRQSLVFLDVPTMPQPEAYIGHGATLVDDKGAFTNDATREFLGKFLTAFHTWIERNQSRSSA